MEHFPESNANNDSDDAGMGNRPGPFDEGGNVEDFLFREMLEPYEGYAEDMERAWEEYLSEHPDSTVSDGNNCENVGADLFDENGNLLPSPDVKAEMDRLSPFLSDDGMWNFGDLAVEDSPGYLDTMSAAIRLERGVIDFKGWLAESRAASQRTDSEEPPH